MTNYTVKSGTGSSQICFTNPAKSGSGQISQKQIQYSPIPNFRIFLTESKVSAFHIRPWELCCQL